MGLYIDITAKRRLKRHTPRKTNRQENGQETVLLSFRGILGGHKADPPRLPPPRTTTKDRLTTTRKYRFISINGETGKTVSPHRQRDLLINAPSKAVTKNPFFAPLF